MDFHRRSSCKERVEASLTVSVIWIKDAQIARWREKRSEDGRKELLVWPRSLTGRGPSDPRYRGSEEEWSYCTALMELNGKCLTHGVTWEKLSQHQGRCGERSSMAQVMPGKRQPHCRMAVAGADLRDFSSREQCVGSQAVVHLF